MFLFVLQERMTALSLMIDVCPTVIVSIEFSSTFRIAISTCSLIAAIFSSIELLFARVGSLSFCVATSRDCECLVFTFPLSPFGLKSARFCISLVALVFTIGEGFASIL